MPASSGSRHHTIHSHTGPRALSFQTRRALESLGYSIVPGSAGTEKNGKNGKVSRPALRLVDDRHLGSAPPAEQDPDTPIVLLVGSRSQVCHDPRIIAHIRRPAQLRDLYQSFQSALERHPRTAPRVATRLPARCIRTDRHWPGALLSLSEGGCLVATSEPIGEGARVKLQFAIPADSIITTRAKCVYLHKGQMGLAFWEPSVASSQAIKSFVASRLAAL